MSNLSNGVYVPPKAVAHFEGKVVNYAPNTVYILEANRYAGSGIGSAVISYQAAYAWDATPEMGKAARITMGGTTVFRGVVGNAPFEVGTDQDEVQLVLFDDKWLMQSKTIGQIGIGTQAGGESGFKDVAFEVIFNKDGQPNKNPSSREFHTGSAAVFWTLKDIMLFLFDYYIDSDVATCAETQLSTAYLRTPSHLNFVGMSALQAVDEVTQAAGETWGLIPDTSTSTFIAVRPGSGTEKKARMFSPQGGAGAGDAGAYHVDQCRSSMSIKDVRDVYQVKSARIIKERVHSNKGDDPLLLGAAFNDKEFYYRYKVDITKYEDNDLGANLTSGSKPKPWLKELVTRLNAGGSTYLTAPDLVSNPALKASQRISKPPVWLSLGGTEEKARLVTGGCRIDTENGTIEFKQRVKLKDDTDETTNEIEISSWATVGVWATLVTVLELPQYLETDTDNKYLPKSFMQVIQKSDLVPERRQDSWLPDLQGGNNDISKLATSSEEKYVDIEAPLQDVIDSAIASTPSVETPVDFRFPFMPTLQIGDRLSPAGRDVNTTGNEVVTMISYTFKDGVPSYMQARSTNITTSVDPENFVEAA